MKYVRVFYSSRGNGKMKVSNGNNDARNGSMDYELLMEAVAKTGSTYQSSTESVLPEESGNISTICQITQLRL